MRILILHVDYFKSEITEKGRSKLVEEYKSPVTEVKEGIVVLASVEKQDETNYEEVARKVTNEIAEIADKLKTGTIVLHPFAHLFGELAAPQIAIEALKVIESNLVRKGFNTIRTPFGWFNTLEFKAKGHPLSRVSRIIASTLDS